MNIDDAGIEAHVDAIKKVKQRVEDRLLRIPGVNGVGIGPKFKGGKTTGEWAITVLIDRKKPPSEIPADELIPDEIEGFKTDVDECGPITVVGPPTIVGGMNLETDGGGLGGTLGCVLEEPSAAGGHSNFYVLTNQHVLLRGSNITVPSPLPLVGSTICSICSKCCNEVIGRVFAVRLNLFVDAAIAFLDKGVKYLAEVKDVGTINGKDSVGASQLKDAGGKLIYSVVKYGQATGLTKGKVRDLDVSGPSRLPDGKLHRQMKDQIRIVPDSDSFSEPGDSGSAVLNATSRKIVALLFGNNKQGHGFASPIEKVLDAFKPEFSLSVVTANAPGDVRTVPALAVEGLTNDASIPSFAGSGQAVRTLEHQLLLQAQEEILQTEAGQRYAQIVLQHHAEVRNLIDTNRRVATAWHRNGGPTIVQKMIRAVQTREVPLPSLIKEQLVSDCIEKILNVLSKYGSRELRSSIEIVKPAFKRLGGMTYTEWLGQLTFSDFPDPEQCICMPLKQS